MRVASALKAAAVGLVGAASVGAAAPAIASTQPAVATGIHVASATHTSFTVAMNVAAHTTRYVVFASRTRSQLEYDNLSKSYAGRTRASSSQPRVTVSGLTYTTGIYYYRVQTRNSTGSTLATIREAHVAPYRPSYLHLVNPSGHEIGLTWPTVSANGYTVEQATNSTFSANRRWYSITGQSSEFTPSGLNHGTKYYFRLRATNGGASHSGFTATVSATFAGHQLAVTVLAYNVLHHKFDGTTESGNTIADWLTQRLPKAAALVNEADPDVMSIEEADDYVDNIKTTQVQSLQHWLLTHYGLTYGLADGDDVDGSPRTGNYVLYRTDKFAPVPGTTGRWTLSNNRWATYVELASLSTGARFYVVSVHLAQVKTSEAPDVNALRKIETQTLLADAANQAGTVPVLYAGDFNSYTGLGSQDTPGHVMLSAHVAEGMAVAQSRTVTQYGTVNDYRRVPPLHSTRWIDRFFTTPGIATRWWTQILHLTNGAFVGTIPSDHNPIVAGINVQY